MVTMETNDVVGIGSDWRIQNFKFRVNAKTTQLLPNRITQSNVLSQILHTNNARYLYSWTRVAIKRTVFVFCFFVFFSVH